MKKIFVTRNIIIAVAVLLAVLAFIFAFQGSFNGSVLTYKGVIIGDQYTVSNSTGISIQTYYTNELALPGIVLVLVGGLCGAVFAFFSNKTWGRVLLIVCSVIAVIGGIGIFFAKDGYAMGYVDYQIKKGILDVSERENAIRECKKGLENFSLNWAIFVTAIMGILSGVTLLLVLAFDYKRPRAKRKRK